MFKDFSEDMKLSTEKNRGMAVAMDKHATLDGSAAASLRNVLLFFSLTFRYPRKAIYKELERMLPVFDDFLNAYAGKTPELPEEVDLQAEYVRLFVNGRNGVPVAPYASCHLDGGILKGESYYRLCQIMEKAGFMLDKSVGELEDHLAVLLEFGSMLTDRLIEASASGGGQLEESMNIFREVIARYLRPLAKAILASFSKCSALDFYSVSSSAMCNFLADVEKIYTHVFGVPMVAGHKRGVKK